MTLQACYAALGGNYEDVIGRLRSERLVQKYVLRFPQDGSFALLQSALQEENLEEAFRAAHTLKGLCQTLGFAMLEQPAVAVTEALRGGDLAAGAALFPQLQQSYETTLQAIAAFSAALPPQTL